MQSELALHLEKVIAQLREEKILLDQVILDLERLHTGRKRPRGRPAGPSGLAQKLNRPRRAGLGGEIG